MGAPTLANTLGAAYLGTCGAAILFGITVLQVYLYYQRYPNDWVFQKISVPVATLLFLDAFHLALTIQVVYYYLVENFGNFEVQALVYWGLKLQIAINVVIVLMVQCLYAIRIWRLGRNYSLIWPSVVVAALLTGIGLGIVLAVKTCQITTFAELETVSWVICSSFAAATAIDILIACVMCFYLDKSRTSFVGTNYRIVIIMRYVLVSGFLTSACSMAALITYTTMKNNLIFLGVEFLLTKLYINSFIAMLNARQSIRSKETSVINLSSPRFRGGGTGSMNFQGTFDDKEPPSPARQGFPKDEIRSPSAPGVPKLAYGLDGRRYRRSVIGVAVHRSVDTHVDEVHDSEISGSPV